MNHKNLLLILFFCLFLTPFMANGATVGGYFQIDVNVLRDGNNNPISLNNIALYRDEQSTFPEFFTGETIYEGYSYTSLYQELTVGQSYKLGFGNMGAFHLRYGALAGMMVRQTDGLNCSTACSSWGFVCDDYAQQTLASTVDIADAGRMSPGSYSTGPGTSAPSYALNTSYSGYCSNCGTGRTNYPCRSITVPPSDLSTVTCTSSGQSIGTCLCCLGGNPARLCACGGWRIIVTI